MKGDINLNKPNQLFKNFQEFNISIGCCLLLENRSINAIKNRFKRKNT